VPVCHKTIVPALIGFEIYAHLDGVELTRATRRNTQPARPDTFSQTHRNRRSEGWLSG
jgi:hypothetical protein